MKLINIMNNIPKLNNEKNIRGGIFFLGIIKYDTHKFTQAKKISTAKYIDKKTLKNDNTNINVGRHRGTPNTPSSL